MFGPHLDRIRLGAGERPSCARLRGHVDMLAEVIGQRHVERYGALMAAERYVRDQLRGATGLAVGEQAYTVMGRVVRNLIVEQPGVWRPGEVVVLGAHYDSVEGTPGADDNASAVAGLIEAARALSRRRLARTVRYVAFVNEEPPFYKGPDMGSLRYARRCRARGEKIVGMINLEMIGYYSDALGSQAYPPLGGLERLMPRRANFVTICSDFPSARLLGRVAWGFRRAVRFPMIPFPAPRSVGGPDMSDHWSFWECGYPAVMVTDTSFLRNRHYHGRSDRLGTLYLPAMTRVVRGVTGAVGDVAGVVGGEPC